MTKMTDPLVRKVRAFCERHDLLPGGGTVLCALSGGRDSMAMLHILSRLAEEGFRVAAAHFNHRLRSAADRDEAFVRDWCRERDIPLTCGAGDVRTFAAREGLGIEDAARKLRYAFLETVARDMGADRIATAHHREDNAETVLLHLLRGTGLQGLGGIAPVRGKIVRPLLETSRAEIDEYVQRNSIPYVEDESNQDTHFTRNRLRLEVLPRLELLNPALPAAFPIVLNALTPAFSIAVKNLFVSFRADASNNPFPICFEVLENSFSAWAASFAMARSSALDNCMDFGNVLSISPAIRIAILYSVFLPAIFP